MWVIVKVVTVILVFVGGDDDGRCSGRGVVERRGDERGGAQNQLTQEPNVQESHAVNNRQQARSCRVCARHHLNEKMFSPPRHPE